MKRIILVIAMTLVIIIGVIFARSIVKENQEVETSSLANISNHIKNNIENVIVNNEILNDTTNEIANETINEIANETPIETPKENFTGEEKAKAIVKKDWGEDNTVYFTVDSKGNSEYEVQVRESATTKILYRYIVNVDTEEFSSELEAH